MANLTTLPRNGPSGQPFPNARNLPTARQIALRTVLFSRRSHKSRNLVAWGQGCRFRRPLCNSASELTMVFFRRSPYFVRSVSILWLLPIVGDTKVSLGGNVGFLKSRNSSVPCLVRESDTLVWRDIKPHSPASRSSRPRGCRQMPSFVFPAKAGIQIRHVNV